MSSEIESKGFAVEEVVNHLEVNSNSKGYSSKENTWEPQGNLNFPIVTTVFENAQQIKAATPKKKGVSPSKLSQGSSTLPAIPKRKPDGDRKESSGEVQYFTLETIVMENFKDKQRTGWESKTMMKPSRDNSTDVLSFIAAIPDKATDDDVILSKKSYEPAAWSEGVQKNKEPGKENADLKRKIFESTTKGLSNTSYDNPEGVGKKQSLTEPEDELEVKVQSERSRKKVKADQKVHENKKTPKKDPESLVVKVQSECNPKNKMATDKKENENKQTTQTEVGRESNQPAVRQFLDRGKKKGTNEMKERRPLKRKLSAEFLDSPEDRSTEKNDGKPPREKEFGEDTGKTKEEKSAAKKNGPGSGRAKEAHRIRVIDRILGGANVLGELMLLIKWKGWPVYKAELVPAKVANLKYPQEVISFYQERLVFGTPPPGCLDNALPKMLPQ